MTSPEDTSASVVNLSERGWPRIGPDLPDGLIPVSRSGNDQQPYDIKIEGESRLEVFTVYYYIWDGANAGQADTLYTEVSGAFQMGGGNDTVTNKTAGTGEFPNPYFLGGEGDDLIDGSSGQGMTAYGGGGDDILYGGALGGTFDGGAGSDTFGVVYGNLLKNAVGQGPDGMQLVVDLTQGYDAERPASEDPNPGTAPVGTTLPFDDSVPNTYKLVDIENAIGGPLNDWIRAAWGSVIGGGRATTSRSAARATTS